MELWPFLKSIKFHEVKEFVQIWFTQSVLKLDLKDMIHVLVQYILLIIAL